MIIPAANFAMYGSISKGPQILDMNASNTLTGLLCESGNSN